MKYKNCYLTLLMTIVIAILLLSCVDLRDSDFYPDDENGRLPKYSEKGFDIAGAIVNDNVWRAERVPFSDIMLLDISKEDTMVFEMYGKLIDGSAAGDFVDLYLYQTGISINTFAELKNLEGKRVQLDGMRNYAEMVYGPKNENPKYYLNGTGNLVFQSIRQMENITYRNTTGENLFSLHPVYISGTFDLIFSTKESTQIKVEKGRFDFKLYTKS